ncbi:MAG: hypothetical protein JWP45_660 [Mucilaginibacter sp.]|nr:hypothetical protein [Mucilaginibacter sp.]
MNKISIQSVTACDAGKAALPASPTLAGANLVTLNPPPLGKTGSLFIRIVCKINPAGAGTVSYRLTLLDLADWAFTGASKSVLTYTRNTSNGTSEFLDFELNMLNPCAGNLPARIRVEAMDPAVPPPNISKSSVTLSCK